MITDLNIVGLGEALFDLLPTGRVLGGATLNVACHAHALLSERGGQGVVASRVGDDELGDEIVAQLTRRGMATDYVQRDSAHPTGIVNVTLQAGQPTFEIVANVAWDCMEFTPGWSDLAGRATAVCFGTLAQRSTDIPRGHRRIFRRRLWRNSIVRRKSPTAVL